MIDMFAYRLRIGCFNNRSFRWGKGSGNRNEDAFHQSSHSSNYINECQNTREFVRAEQVWHIASVFLSYLYTILLLCLISLVLNTSAEGLNVSSQHYTFINLRSMLGINKSNSLGALSFLGTSYVKLAYFCLMAKIIRRHPQKFLTYHHSKKRLERVLKFLVAGILLLNFLMIGICNPSLLNPGPNSMSISFQNVQGLIPFSQLGKNQPQLDHSKIFEINAHLNICKPDVLILNETWLNKSIKNHEVIGHRNYDVFRNDRSQVTHPVDPNNPKKFRKFGGGVLIAVRSNINANFKRLSMRKGAEILAVEVTVGNNKYIFCTVYRVGTLGENNHESIMQSIKSMYNGKNLRKVFIVGDFNLSSIDWATNNGSRDEINRIDKLFLDSFSELGLHQCVQDSTHVKGKTLDLLLTNYRSLVSEVVVDMHNPICKSDHYPLFFKVEIATKNKKVTKRKIYNFKRANWRQLNEDLKRVPWEALIDCREPDYAWNNFKTVLFKLVEKHIPKIAIKDDFTAPWFDAECFEAYRSKMRAHKKFKLDSNFANELKRDSTRSYFKDICNRKMRDNLYNSDDPALITKKFWSHVKSNSKSHRMPECMSLDGVFRNLPSDKADLFNSYFFDQFSAASNYGTRIDWSNDAKFDIDFDEVKVKDLLAAINSNKACGPDGIHGKILKHCAASLSHPLSMLFRLSYNSGCLPNDWKVAHVVPVHKKGCKDNVENYRPISLTSLVMKTFERILKQELLFHTAHLLDERQHGFLNNKSCTTNMVNFVDSVVISLNDVDTLSTDIVYFDFSKAFDSVNHDRILKKLKDMYGIDGRLLKFIENYLQGREQSVVIENCISSSKPVLSGVPQGSILGPILFVLFINDLPSGLSPGTNLALYADDTKIWRGISTESDHVILQNDVNYLNEWATLNKMKFHPLKCKVISVHSKPSPLANLPFVNFHYHLGENLLQYAENEKDLGVIINTKLNFNEQQESLLSKANQQFGLVKRTCNFVKDIKRRRVLYLTLIRSQFEHCSPIWRPSQETMLEKFENFQKKCIKWILSEQELSYSHGDTYIRKCRQVNILPLRCRFKLNDLILFHKILNGLIPLHLPEYLQWFNGSSRLRVSHLDHRSLISTLVPARNNFKNLEKSYFYRTHTLWNSIPLAIREIESPSQFKSRLVAHFWESIINSNHEDSEIDTND